MPSVSQKQHNFMEMCKHSPQHAQGKCPSMKVATEFVEADKGHKFSTDEAAAALAKRGRK